MFLSCAKTYVLAHLVCLTDGMVGSLIIGWMDAKVVFLV